MKKRILLIFTCIMAIMLCIGTLPCFAEETAEAITETIPAQTEAPTTEPTAEPTVFSRVWEYCTENKTEMIGIAGDTLIIGLGLIIRRIFKKNTKDIAADLKVVKGDAAGTASSQSSVVGAVNKMIDGYNEMRTSYEKYEAVEDDRNKLVGAVMVQNTAILEILLAVYVNSKNLPQGVKDLVTLKYVNCQKALGDDETLRAVVEAVREKIGTTALLAPSEAESAAAEATETTADTTEA